MQELIKEIEAAQIKEVTPFNVGDYLTNSFTFAALPTLPLK